jgi:peptidyl-prolyl cis-trans isomerase SurA
VRLEAVQVSEILILTPQPYDSAQVEEAKRKAEALRDEIKRGGSFSDIAKANSQGPTAATGGNLGTFYRGDLAPALEDVVFHMKVGDVSDVVRTKQGFLILQVTGWAGPNVRTDLPLEVLNAPMTPSCEPI